MNNLPDFDEWTRYGGVWRQNGDEVGVQNAPPADRKLVLDGIRFSASDIELRTEIEIPDKGDSGLLWRVTDPADGTDACNGYYAGVSTNSMVVGRMDRVPGNNKGRWTELGRGSRFHEVGQRVEMSIMHIGGRIVCVVDDMTPITLDERTHMQGAIGLRCWRGASSFGHLYVRVIGADEDEDETGPA